VRNKSPDNDLSLNLDLNDDSLISNGLSEVQPVRLAKLKKKKVSTMQTLKNRVLPRKTKRRSKNVDFEYDSNAETVFTDDEDSYFDESKDVLVDSKNDGVYEDKDEEILDKDESLDYDNDDNSDELEEEPDSPPNRTVRRRKNSVGNIESLEKAPEQGGGDPDDMQGFLRQKLLEWQIPKKEWKIPAPGDEDLKNKDADPETTAKRIKAIELACYKDEKRSQRLVSEIKKLREKTQRSIDDLKQAIQNMEGRLDMYEEVVGGKEKQMKEVYQNYKAQMHQDIREKVRKQLDHHETEYFNLMTTIQQRIKNVSNATISGGGFVDNALHRGFSLVIAGAGTIAHVVSMCVGFVLHPTTIFFPKKPGE